MIVNPILNGEAQEAPVISVSAGGLITATAGDKSATQQLPTQESKTVTPGTSTKTAVASGRYTTGNVNVAGSANLVPANIKSGVNIFGVTGAFEGGTPELVTGTITSASPRNFLGFLYSDGSDTVKSGQSTGKLVTIQCEKNTMLIMYGDSGISLSGGIMETEYRSAYFVTGNFNVNN